jgi:hypothetical protein
MDPRECWRRIVAAAERLDLDGPLDEDECREMAEHVLALRDWFNGGGFVPDMRMKGGV